MKTLIKFEKEINDCRYCPFHKTITMGNPSNNVGEWLESKCEKIGIIKSHDYDDYNSKFIIPKECPFKN